MSWWLILGLFRRGLFLSEINAFDLYTRQFATVADRAVITFAPLIFECDNFLVLALFDNFSSHLCSGDERAAVSHAFPSANKSTSPDVPLLPASTSSRAT